MLLFCYIGKCKTRNLKAINVEVFIISETDRCGGIVTDVARKIEFYYPNQMSEGYQYDCLWTLVLHKGCMLSLKSVCFAWHNLTPVIMKCFRYIRQSLLLTLF